MGIQFIIGRSGVGKSHHMYTEIKKKIEENHKKLYLIVPEQFTLQAERDLITKGNLEGIMGIEVLSFTRLAYRVLNETGGLTRIHINEIGKNMILRKLILQMEKDLSIYKKTARQPGFVEKLNRVITEMKQQDIQASHLKQQLEAMKEEGILKLKLSDITVIYEAFNAYLENKYIDTEDHINLLIANLDNTNLFDDAIIWVDGFYQFTPQTIRILEKLMKKSQQLNILLTMDPKDEERDGDLFQLTKQTFNKIRAVANGLKLPQEIVKLSLEGNQYVRSLKTPELIHLEEELYAYPFNQYREDIDFIKGFAASNRFAEVENVAAEIIRLVRDKGYRWRDIAVVGGSIGDYQMVLKSAFQEYQIPYFLDEKRNIDDHPIIQLILSVLDICIGGYRHHDVFRYLRTGFSDLPRDQWEELENYCLQYGIKGKKWTKEFQYEGDYDLVEIENSRKLCMKPIINLVETLGSKGKISELSKGLYYFLKDLKIEDKLNSWIETLKEKGLFDYVNENTQIWNTLMEILDQLNEILGEEEITIKEYRDILESGFSSTEIGVIPSTIDEVLIGNIQRSRSHDIKALFLIGVNDGIIPSIGEDEGLLNHQERSLLMEVGFEFGHQPDSHLYEEKFNIYASLTKASQYLWISYALADQEGRALRPSILMDTFKKLYPRLKVHSDVVNSLSQQLQLIASPQSTFKYLIENLRLLIDRKGFEDIWWDVYQWYFENPLWQDKRQRAVEALFHDNQVDYINGEKAKELYTNLLYTSVSRLERYAGCPFSHFVAYGLKPTDRRVYEINSPDMGIIFHQTMETFEKEIINRGHLWHEIDQDCCHQLVDEIIDDMAENFQNGILYSSHRYQYLIKRLKRISRRALWTLTCHLKKGGFIPFGHEITFGKGGILPPMVMKLPSGEEIHLEGRIDRVDFYEDENGSHVKIIDYKSGNKDFQLTEVYYGLQLQLMVYLDVLLSMSNFLKRDKIHPAGVFYFKIDDPLIRTTERGVESIERAINKELKMKGMVIKDINIIKEIDREINKSSDVIPVGLNKGDEISKNSSVLSHEDFKKVLTHVRQVIEDIAGEIMKGRVAIEPCKRGKIPFCNYCQYSSICQFDKTLENNQYRVLKDLKDEEIIDRISKRREGEDNDKMD
ncbi:helicase-exonuclease AddAB subunit AddB [Alkaliphilus serpentinus]|uniref:ATP-dependent helicase/deoxyribonuclease subunit B n=1 Tax=Alkaliphilus serpentinus TaxID=1482731 RepID=A0A833M8N3_9FIRM|nr:helicase-exonuclease AddAB subunit AddB [Alkaliphilus serpentinus]KAB3533441.1 helicase-exonuclease AddAB subunit AddB [Alkaliphilus serpentinus]